MPVARVMDVIVKEYKQLYDMNSFSIVCPDDLTPNQKQDTFSETNLSKEKRCRKIKVIACVYGRAQRAYITREETA